MMSSRIGRLSQTYIQRTAHVRARFEYDPSKDTGLPKQGLAFHFGDILHIVNDNDQEWWQAEKLTTSGEREAFGVVPSKYRALRALQARQARVDYLNQAPESPVASKTRSDSSTVKKFLCFSCGSEDRQTSSSEILLSAYDFESTPPTLPYEYVKQRQLIHTRPVTILGPLQAAVFNAFLIEFPDMYDAVVPSTTREKRPGEEDGVDYHYVSSKEEMQQDVENGLYIEAGYLNDNWYGTSLSSVKEVVKQDKHCILDLVSVQAMKKLLNADLYPITIHVHPNLQAKMETELTDEEKAGFFDKAVDRSSKFVEHITAVLREGSSFSDIKAKVHEIIQEQSDAFIWVPACFA